MVSALSFSRYCQLTTDRLVYRREPNAVESRFLEPPRERKIDSRNREVGEIESKITVKFIQGKRKLVLEIGRFEKSRVREIGIPLYCK